MFENISEGISLSVKKLNTYDNRWNHFKTVINKYRSYRTPFWKIFKSILIIGVK